MPSQEEVEDENSAPRKSSPPIPPKNPTKESGKAGKAWKALAVKDLKAEGQEKIAESESCQDDQWNTEERLPLLLVSAGEEEDAVIENERMMRRNELVGGVMGRILLSAPSLCTSLTQSTGADFHYQIAPFVDYSPTEVHFDWEEWERLKVEEAKDLAWAIEEMERRKGLEDCRIEQFKKLCEDVGRLHVGDKGGSTKRG